MVLIVLMSFTNIGIYMSDWATAGSRVIFGVLR
jgi:hypothetical protein